MKASELRIGNLLFFSNGIQPKKKIAVGRRFFSSASIEGEDGDFTVSGYYQPIPLTEEWLLKFGFKPTNDHFYAIKTGITWVTLEVCLDSRVILFNRKKTAFIDLEYTKYVHQLQNIFRDLTGKELTVK